MEYCDAYDREGFLKRFPEAASEIDGFPERVAYKINFDRDRFVDLIGENSLDFIVANHVLEHLVNPLDFLEQCYKLLKPGGIAYIALPDKRLTFDCYRRRTPLSDVVDRYRANVTEVDEDRIIEYINQTAVEKLYHGERPAFGRSAVNFADVIKVHRERSIHVNVWTLDDFVQMLMFLGRDAGCPFELIDGSCHHIEFALVLRKADSPSVVSDYPIVLTRILMESQQAALERKLDQIHAALASQLASAIAAAPRVVNARTRLKAAVAARFPGAVRILRRLRHRSQPAQISDTPRARRAA